MKALAAHSSATGGTRTKWQNGTLPRAAPLCMRHVRHSRAARRIGVCVQARFSTATNNPALTYGKVNEAVYQTKRGSGDNTPMTLDGTVNKAALLLTISAVSAAYTWMQMFSATSAAGMMAVLGASRAAGILGLVAAVASMFKPQWALYTAPVYALAQGVALAGFSAFLEVRYAGIAMNAIILTFGTAASLFFALRTRLITVTDHFRDMVRIVMGGYFISMLALWALSMFGMRMPGLFASGPIAVGLGLLSAGLAASSLLIDFDWLQKASYQRMPKWMEWYGAQSVMITLVWMYTSMLRLLMLFSGGRDD